MSRLYDRIMSGKLRPLAWQISTMTEQRWLVFQSDIRRDIGAAHIIVADNIASYFYSGTDQEEWDIQKDFPCLAPPFPLFWIEWRQPSVAVSCELGVLRKGVDEGPWVHSAGVLFSATNLSKSPTPDYDQVCRELKLLMARNGASIEAKCKQYGMEFVHHLTPDEKRTVAVAIAYEKLKRGEALEYEKGEYWALNATIFLEMEHNGPIVVPSVYQLTLDQQGSVLDQVWGMTTGPESTNVDLIKPYMEVAAETAPAFFPAFLALSFMHCKNVKLLTEEPPAKLSKVYQKRHGRPLVRYHTLEITPMKEVLRREGQSETFGLKKALHICRGHFATYSEERPLFGKVSGRFFIPMHARGSARQGAVVKDYAINRPKK